MRSKSGFTLIELLVVIAIIAILAAILFPVFLEAKEHGRQAKCLSNMKQLWLAFQEYRANFSDVMPPLSSTIAGRPPDWCGSPWCNQQVVHKDGQLWPYVHNHDVFVCPTDYRTDAGDKAYPASVIKQFALSYSVNYSLNGTKFDPLVARKPSRILFMIQEERMRINDGYFAWQSTHDIPDAVHYDGTTVSYCDGHARWFNKKELDRQMSSGQWDPKKP